MEKMKTFRFVNVKNKQKKNGQIVYVKISIVTFNTLNVI